MERSASSHQTCEHPRTLDRGFTNLYYSVKPLLPRGLRWNLRRIRARWILCADAEDWPISPGSEVPPEGWKGWPDGKQFAFVLTHDVEGQVGMDQLRDLATWERENYGFRSSFNLIPDGPYQVSQEMRDWLREQDLELGVHDLHHDGFLYRSRSHFRENARSINAFLEEWGATGFRSGFMLHELDWLHDLKIRYDCSTFDTDPFEPQPVGCHSIFPFYHYPKDAEEGAAPYVELPYTLAQDSTVFLLLGETDTSIWKDKLDWIVRNGGMALVIIHPDYVDMGDGKAGAYSYPLELLDEFFSYLTTHYAGQYWNPRAGELAEWFGRTMKPQTVNSP